MAVNDHHVMKAWGEALGGDGKIDFVADGNGAYARALGLEVDMSPRPRQAREALLDAGRGRRGEDLNFEPEGGKGIQATGAATMLGQV